MFRHYFEFQRWSCFSVKAPRVVKKSQKKTVKIVMRYFSNTNLGGTTKSIRPIADYAIGLFICPDSSVGRAKD